MTGRLRRGSAEASPPVALGQLGAGRRIEQKAAPFTFTIDVIGVPVVFR